MADIVDISKISYITCNIKEFSVKPVLSDSGRLLRHTFAREDVMAEATVRTRSSLFANIGVSPNIESLFSIDEVFDRAIAVGKIPDTITLCVESTLAPDSSVTHLAHAFSFKNEFIKIKGVVSAIADADPDSSSYFHGGVVQSHHTAKDAEANFSVNGINFSGGFVINAPIDGYGDPSTYMKMFMGGNGVTLEAPAFKHKIPMGSTGIEAIKKTVKGFRNPEGFELIQSQMELAHNSWASVSEALGLHQILFSSPWDDKNEQVRTLNEFNRTLGRWRGYLSDVIRNNADKDEDVDDRIATAGVAALIFIPDKDKKSLPVDASVMDLIKFACKIRTTSQMPEGDKRKMDAYVGKLLSSRFDLAGQKKRITSYDKFFS